MRVVLPWSMWAMMAMLRMKSFLLTGVSTGISLVPVFILRVFDPHKPTQCSSVFLPRLEPKLEPLFRGNGV